MPVNSSFSGDEALRFALENGIINIDEVHSQYIMNKREKVLKKHPFAITPPAGTNTRWQTYYLTETGVKKQLRAQTKENLLDRLADIYFSNAHIENLTVQNLFDEWLEWKTPFTNSNNTVMRYKQLYKKYVSNLPFNDMKVISVNTANLETICNLIIKDNDLTRKAWINLKSILNGMFNLAVRRQYIKSNPLDDITIYIKYRQVNKKPSDTQTFDTDEIKKLFRYLDIMYLQTSDSSFMAVKMNFYLGLRVGELVALKWEDFDNDKLLHICCEEIRDQKTGQTVVVNHTKTHHDRFVTMVPPALEIINNLPREGEFIFMRNGENLHARQINYVLEKYAERTGHKIKSSHKVRKTYASRLSANGVPLDFIREQLGHSDLATTLGYIYNPLTKEETYNLLTNAFNDN